MPARRISLLLRWEREVRVHFLCAGDLQCLLKETNDHKSHNPVAARKSDILDRCAVCSLHLWHDLHAVEIGGVHSGDPADDNLRRAQLDEPSYRFR